MLSLYLFPNWAPRFSLSTKALAPALSLQLLALTLAAPLLAASASTSAGVSTECEVKIGFDSSVSTTVQPSSVSESSSSSTPETQAPELPFEIAEKTVQETIKDWSSAAKFQELAVAIAEQDGRILHNQDVHVRLESEVAEAVETQTHFEQQLELIESHEQAVDKALQNVEKEAEHACEDEHGLLCEDEAAAKRDLMYEQAAIIERELKQMVEQIKSIMQTFSGYQSDDLEMIDGMTPIDLVVRILNSRLSSLMRIDQKGRIGRLDDVGDSDPLVPSTSSKSPCLGQNSSCKTDNKNTEIHEMRGLSCREDEVGDSDPLLLSTSSKRPCTSRHTGCQTDHKNIEIDELKGLLSMKDEQIFSLVHRVVTLEMKQAQIDQERVDWEEKIAKHEQEKNLLLERVEKLEHQAMAFIKKINYYEKQRAAILSVVQLSPVSDLDYGD